MYDSIISRIEKGDLAEAERLSKIFYKKKSNDSRAAYLLGFIFLKQDKIEMSVKFFAKAVKIEDNIKNLFAYAEALTKTKKLKETINCYKKILSINDRHEPTLVNLSYIYLLCNEYKKSEQCLLSAIKLNKNHAVYYKNLGNLYKRQNLFDKALENYKHALKLDSNIHEAKKGIGLTLLTQKKYDLAWEYYEARIHARQNSGKLFMTIKNNLFLTNDFTQIKNIVLVSEQGLGEHILFSSIYNDVIKKNINLKFIIDIRLKDIFKRSFGDHEYISTNNFVRIEQLVKENYKFIYAGSLGKFFRNNIQLFNGKPFFKPNINKINKYKTYLSKYNFKKIIGIAWKSKSEFVGKKSLILSKLKPLIEIKDIGFVSLQYGDNFELQEYNKINRKKIIEIENLDLFNEIDDLLSLIYNLDMIITSPNLNTHLAGAIGKKCITIFDVGYEDIMNSSLNDGVSEWYKSVKIVQINNDLEKQINKIIKNI